MTPTSPVSSASGPVSKLSLPFSLDPPVVPGQPGFARQFQDFQQLAASANASPTTAPAGSNWTALSSMVRGDHLMVSAPTNLAPPSPLTFVTPSPDGATGQPQPTSATLVGQALPPALPLQDPGAPVTSVTPVSDSGAGQPQPTSATLVGQALPPALPLQDGRASVPPLTFVTPSPDGATGQPQPTSATLVGQALPPALPLQDTRASVPPMTFVTPSPDGATGQPQSTSATSVGQALPPALPLQDGRASVPPLTFATPIPDGGAGQPQSASATLVGQAVPPALPLQDTRASVPPLSFVTPVPDGATGQPQPTSATLVGQAVPPALPLQDGRVSVPPPTFVTPVPDGATGQPQSASATLVGQALPPALPLPSSRASAQPSLSPSQQSDAAVGGTSELDSDSAPLVRRFVTSATYFPGRPDVGPMVGPGGRCAPASASTPEGIAIPRPATAKLALSPSAQPLPGKLGFSASPSRTWLSGTIQGDRPTGSFVSGVGENASPATEPGAPVATVPLAAWAEQAAFPNPVQHPHESATPAQGGGESAAANSDAAPLAASGSGAGKLAVTSRQFARPSASTTQTAALPRRTTATAGLAPSVGVLPAPGKIGSSASLSRTRASGTIQGAPPTGSLASGVGENAGPATASGAPAANMPLGSWVEQAASPNPVWNPHASAAPAQGGGESAAGKPAGATGRAQRPSTSTAEAVATPRPATATAKLAPAASAQPVPGKIGFSAIPSWTRASVAMQADRPTGRLASGVGENASPASAPSAPAPPVPLAAWFQQAASPNPVPNPGESATPAQSGGKSSDHGSPASDALQFPAGGKETGNPDLAAPAAISLQPQAPPASRRFSQIAKDGVEDPASGAPDGADSAPVVAANRAGAQAASTIARLPFAPAAPSDTGIAPPAVPGSTPEKPGLTVSGPEPRAAGADAGTPGKAEPAPADLAVAVKVKPQASVAASAQSAPTREPRRVDLADPPPATRLHTETSRTGAWAAGEAPARGGAQLAAQTAAQSATRPPERPEATPLRAEESASKAAPLKDLSIQVAQSDREGVELRVVEREGELHIAVRTGDADLAHGLRQGLPELVNRLDQGGYRTEAWRPAGMVSGSEPSSQAHTRSSDSRNPDSQSQPGWSQQERGQRDHNQSNRPKWVEELEGNLAGGGERSTGEFHGFTN